MKKALYILLPIIMVLFASCESDYLKDEMPAAAGDGVTFIISTPVEETDWMSRAEDGEALPEQLTALRYLLADEEGNVLNHFYGRITPELDRLTLEGLAPGSYSVLFLGSSTASDLARIEAPEHISQAWLTNTMESLPLNGSYFFKKVDFEVSSVPEPMQQRVVLDHALAKMKVEITGITPALETLIESVKVSFDEGSQVATSMKADGTFDGAVEIVGYEVRDTAFTLTFNTLPSLRPLSGTVSISAATLSGDNSKTSYRFEGINAEAGKVATITLTLNHPDLRTGYIYIRPKDYYNYNADLMMMEDEPMAVLHDNNHRRFQVCRPLTVSTWENNMRVRLFSAGAVENVDIYANFPSLGIDSVHIAHMTSVHPLLDMLVPMPFIERDCQYFTKDGRRVTIPKMNSLPSDIQWSYTTTDAYLNQLAALKFQNWYAWCPAYEDWYSFYGRTPTCDIIRHAYMVNQCMAIMFDSEEFYTRLEENTGKYNNNGNMLTNEDIINRIYNTSGFGWGSCNPASGAEGWGGGSTMIFMSYYFQNFYPGVSTNKPHTWDRECLFHEHGHCLGFSHTGNMTYGTLWVSLTSNAYVECYLHGKMPYGHPSFINAIPYKRADAPKWCTPRFVPEPAEADAEVPASGAAKMPAGMTTPIA
ncbi:MAG: hypothetical protein K2G35_00695 [Duncaniella sp.]|nr:hypothetical protein [Duncaniella sp.]